MTQPSRKADADAHPADLRVAPAHSLDAALGNDLTKLREAGLERRLRRVEGDQGPSVEIDGQQVLLFCSNNYLGLATHPDVVAAAHAALDRYGAGAVSSRLISGHMAPHAELETTLAEWKHVERALVFSTGYQANVGTLTALLGPNDIVISDELNHASIIDGCRLSRAEIAVYRHNDVADLGDVLARVRGSDRERRCIVVTESVFSMDGDLAPLVDIVEQCERSGAWLMVDEAHAAGVFGPRGAGLVAELGLTERVAIHMGTLGKALGSFGAYVAGSARLIEVLINRSRPFIFTTGLPPAAAAAASAAIEVISARPDLARGLLERSARLGDRLRHAGLDIAHNETQILPIMVGDARRTVDVATRLLEAGVYVAAIRPPTVPQGTSRLRLSLMATHSESDIATAEREIVRALTA